MIELVWKGAVGGIVTALIVVGAKGQTEGFKEASLAGAKAIPAYVAFLIVCYFAIDHLDYRLAIVAGLAAWVAVASVIFLGPRWV